MARQAQMGYGGQDEDIRREIAAYYTNKLLRYGPTPHGVDWTCSATQELWFVQLMKLCDFTKAFSLNDMGCGYGALLAYLAKRHAGTAIDYLGVDVSLAMIFKLAVRGVTRTSYICARTQRARVRQITQSPAVSST